MLVMIRGVTTINNDIADCARAPTVAQDRQALDTDIGALQTAEQVVAHVSGDDLTAPKTPAGEIGVSSYFCILRNRY